MRRLALLLILAVPARALALSQPDGTQIPLHPAQHNLWDLFSGLGEPIDPVADAADVPETYTPSCQLNFELISRGGAGFQNAFGWYNVVDGGAPAQSDLHVLLDCSAQPPDSVPLAIQSSGEFGGGQIGFFLITPQGQSSQCASLTNVGDIYFSQKEYNPDNGLQGGASYIHLLTYDSKLSAATFYFAWEDLFNGGDNEFTDFVAKVNGIRCAGSGGACDTGLLGLCALGTYQCVDGALTCVQQFQPQPESCDGIDTDCDGQPDNDAGCPTGESCVAGRCQPPCGTGELGGQCPSGESCVSGQCVDTACQSINCPGGQSCRGGHCVDPCGGVVCPRGQSCAFGRCIDPCAVVNCGQGEVCQDGLCRDSCACAGCTGGLSCSPDGRCLAAGCLTASCGVGTFCAEDGGCVDTCAGVSCPSGQRCTNGQCVEIPDAGTASSGTGTSTGGTTGTTTSSGTTGSGSTGKSFPDGGPGASTGTSAGTNVKSSGCGCGAADGGVAIFALALLAIRRRR